MREGQDQFTDSLDYKKVLLRLYSFRGWYIFLIISLLVATFIYNQYAQVRYANSTTLYLSQDDKSKLMNSTSDIFSNFGLFNSTENIDNELEVVRSFSLIKKVLTEANFKVTYLAYKNTPLSGLLLNTPFIRKIDLYDQSPIEVIIDQSVPQTVYLDFKITFVNENSFTLEAEGDRIPLYNYIDDKVISVTPAISINQRYNFGDEIKSKYFNFRINKTSNFDKSFTEDYSLMFYLNDINNLTLQYQGSLSAAPTTQRSTLIRITLNGTNQQRITDFLNSLTSAYLGKSVDKKNKTALSTIDFIDTQISDIADSLNLSESNLKNFRASQGVMDLSFQGQQVFEQLNKLENERAAIEVQKKYYQYLDKYLNESQEVTDIMAPTSMNVVDPVMSSLVTQLLSLGAERASLMRNSTSQQNLYLADIDIRIDNLKKTLKETVKNSLQTLNISLNELNYRMAKATGQISQMPKTELQLRGIERKFKLSDAIYTFLMQKRAEAQIAKASSMPDYEVVDAANVVMCHKVTPKTKLNYAVALFLSLLLPSAFILLKDFLNHKISDPDDIENSIRYPVLGKIFHNFHHGKQVVNNHPNSSVTESFRSVRTNFQFFSEGGKRQVLLITSSTSGEGKTFCSINLATVFALNGHKTVLLEFDLRRPKVHQEFDSSNLIGISSFLIDKAIIEDIIVPTHIENLDIISAGPAAPNPAELIGSERTGELIDKLKEMYDYIIIDSAPAGIVAETQLLMKLADLNIFVARINKTIKSAFNYAIKTFENNKLTNVTVLINDLDVKRNSYKYGYDNKYYNDDRGGGFMSRFFRRKKA
jgi:capsular exopolysaccharide synthesis family protein